MFCSCAVEYNVPVDHGVKSWLLMTQGRVARWLARALFGSGRLFSR